MATKKEVLQEVLEHRVVPFYYEHKAKSFYISGDPVPLPMFESPDIYSEFGKKPPVKNIEQLEQEYLVCGQYTDPIALPKLTDFLNSIDDTVPVFSSVANVMSDVHLWLEGWRLNSALNHGEIHKINGNRQMDFVINTHTRLHATGDLTNDGAEHGVFEYGTNNAEDYLSLRPTLLAAIGHLAFLAAQES